jgi:hypothetical protein
VKPKRLVAVVKTRKKIRLCEDFSFWNQNEKEDYRILVDFRAFGFKNQTAGVEALGVFIESIGKERIEIRDNGTTNYEADEVLFHKLTEKEARTLIRLFNDRIYGGLDMHSLFD